MESTRVNKVSRLVQKELGEIFRLEERGSFGNAMITVTKAHVTPDLSLARVYLSLFATKDKDALLESIRGHSGEIRYKLGKRIGKQVRAIPELQFFMDDSLDYIDRIEELLDE
ncbi:MAG: 30S ribosome-binding factor RbfA [Bacteroidales bacterium]|nr:30S ribosome-binding factor RbfA [Bacteroidales bacterium]